MRTISLDDAGLKECVSHLDALDELRFRPVGSHPSTLTELAAQPTRPNLA